MPIFRAASLSLGMAAKNGEERNTKGERGVYAASPPALRPHRHFPNALDFRTLKRRKSRAPAKIVAACDDSRRY